MHAFVSESAISHQWKQFLICDAENVFSILFQAQCYMKHRHPDNIFAKCNIQNIILRPFIFNRTWVTKTKSDECCFIIVDLCEVAYFVQTHIMKHAWKDKKITDYTVYFWLWNACRRIGGLFYFSCSAVHKNKAHTPVALLLNGGCAFDKRYGWLCLVCGISKWIIDANMWRLQKGATLFFGRCVSEINRSVITSSA